MSEVYRMTREEAIEAVKSAFDEREYNVLDKIYADIQKLRNCSCSCSDGIIDDVEDIIDKYRTEREVKDGRLDGRGTGKN